MCFINRTCPGLVQTWRERFRSMVVNFIRTGAGTRQPTLINMENPIIWFDCTLFACWASLRANFQHASRHVPKFSGFPSNPAPRGPPSFYQFPSRSPSNRQRLWCQIHEREFLIYNDFECVSDHSHDKVNVGHGHLQSTSAAIRWQTKNCCSSVSFPVCAPPTKLPSIPIELAASLSKPSLLRWLRN
jgi:hypothetical protein